MTRGPSPDRRSLPGLLRTASGIVVFGASDDPSKAGGRPIRYLRQYGFTGRIFPVNPRRDTVQGLPAVAGLDDVPVVPDIAVIALPAARVAETVRDCGARGIPLAIVFSSGLAEIGGAGAALQDELVRAAAETGIRVLGPNTVGAVSVDNSVMATFMTALDQDRFALKDDGIAFVSQSGALGGFILNLAHSTGVGIGTFVNTGNEADLGIAEIIEDLVALDSTRVILAYIEGIRDGRRFERALAAARERDVPVIVLKVGRSARGAQAAASHTGALAGSDDVFEGVLRRHNVLRANTVEEMLDLGRVMASRKRRPHGRRVSILTLSGGAGALMTDYAEKLGLDVFAWTDEWRSRMAEILPSFASTANPIDTTGAVASDQQMFIDSVGIALANPDTDLAVVLLGNLEAEEDLLCEGLTAAAAGSDKPLIVTWVGGSGRPLTALWEAGIPAYGDPARAMLAAAALADWAGGARPTPGGSADEPAGDAVSADEIIRARTRGRKFLDEVDGKALVARAGVPVVPEIVAHDADAAVRAADELGHPVVVKLLSDRLPHKSELGAVRVGLASAGETRTAASELLDLARSHDLADAALVVQPSLRNDVELILGMSKDPAFGPITLVGIGGVFAELDPDVQIRPAPVSPREARAMIDALRGLPVLQGARGRTPADLDALARVVGDFSRFSAGLADAADSVEVNPLLIGHDGAPVAVDALVVLADAPEDRLREDRPVRTDP
ncbi:acetate--CoA ligase family protein [Actinomadura livida]|uniref:Acetate--CoA ligase family protein n=1 Tax=Actinomadura livida TaxID=79909 RepID=A0A7W7IF22_9ACTN|nr:MULTISPECIES: acetate--CoA ligase family protein [Actinomadura]MBB4775933.1 acyl-CoA synthetase (NDP forming) [Actinomadura catellatispora]GGU16663.1 6-carboxyhexanoate--CoA ligase [Actinomadura livida]